MIKTARYFFVVFFGFIFAYPFFLLLTMSLRERKAIADNPFGLPIPPNWNNYIDVWNQVPLLNSLKNSIVLTIISLILIVLVGVFAAYPLARIRSSMGNYVYVYFLAGMVLPTQLAIIPLYQLFKTVYVLNTPLALILLYIAGTMQFVVFVFTGFIKSIPRELDESAVIDGCGRVLTLLIIIFPLLRPAIVTVMTITSIWIWNDFFGPLVFLNVTKYYTLPLLLFSFTGRYSNDWPHIFALMVIISAPILTFFFSMQKQVIKGFTSGAVKG